MHHLPSPHYIRPKHFCYSSGKFDFFIDEMRDEMGDEMVDGRWRDEMVKMRRIKRKKKI